MYAVNMVWRFLVCFCPTVMGKIKKVERIKKKKDELLLFATTGMDLEGIMLSDTS